MPSNRFVKSVKAEISRLRKQWDKQKEIFNKAEARIVELEAEIKGLEASIGEK